MGSRDFCYWLQGLFELGQPASLDATQTDLIKRHLAMVFVHEIDPSAGPPAVQAKLNQIHEGNPPETPLSPEAQSMLDEIRKSQQRPKIGGVSVSPSGQPIVYRC